MSEADAQQQEPSMEEILASIRRIISEDSEDDEGNEAPEEEAAPEEAPEEPPEEPAAEEEDVLDLTDVVEDEPEPEPEPEPAEIVPLHEPEPEPAEPLLSDISAQAASESLTGLMGAITSQMHIGPGSTVEDIVRELLRPMLKQWLDANLPDVVDSIVREEVEHVVARTRR